MIDKQPMSGLRAFFGAVLFVGWVIETILWAASTAAGFTAGDAGSVVTAALVILLLAVLAGMEGLEDAVIDRWRALFPNRPVSILARWLSARQLFVALIVTAITLLARRSAIAIPGTSLHVTSGILRDLFDLTWTGFTVLWFAQIVPKVLAATNPDRYLRIFRAPLFPAVELVRAMGASKPGEWVASLIARRESWTPVEEVAAAALPEVRPSLVRSWRAIASDRWDEPERISQMDEDEVKRWLEKERREWADLDPHPDEFE